MSITTLPNGRVVVRTPLTLYPDRHQALIDLLQEAEHSGASVAGLIVELMRTGLPAGSAVEGETDPEELVDLSQMAMFMEEE